MIILLSRIWLKVRECIRAKKKERMSVNVMMVELPENTPRFIILSYEVKKKKNIKYYVFTK